MADEDMNAETTPGFKVGEKKTIDQYHQLDQDDDAMQRWKKSLGLATGPTIADPNDPRLCVIKSLSLLVEGRPDIKIDVSEAGAVEKLKEKKFTIKEGAVYQMKIEFVVQHQVLSGLKYIQKVKRGLFSSKDQEMIGSYAPNTVDKPIHSKTFAAETAPSGMTGRGNYNAASRFVDDDNKEHLSFEWAFEIAKDWK